MSIDANLYKIPVFEDVNDRPIAPSANSPGNGSHLIQQHNGLVNAVESAIAEVKASVGTLFSKSLDRWVITEDDYAASSGEKVIFLTNQPIVGKFVYYLYLPDNPRPGDSISFLNTNQSIEIELKPQLDEIYFQGTYYQRLYLADLYKQHTIVYTQQIGWISTNNEIYSNVPSTRYNT